MKTITVIGFILLFFFNVKGVAAMVEPNEYSLLDDYIELVVAVDSDAVQLKRIFNRQAGVEYLNEPIPFFEIRFLNKDIVNAQKDLLISFVKCESNSLFLKGRLKKYNILFEAFLTVKDLGVVNVSLAFENLEKNVCTLNILYPQISNYTKRGENRVMYGMIPQEIGGVIPLEGKYSIGMTQKSTTFLPAAMNSMEVCSIYDYDTGAGMFCADITSDLKKKCAPIQFNLTHEFLKGVYQLNLLSGEKRSLPILALGVFPSGGWQKAVDYYTGKVAAGWNIPVIPTWFKEAGGIYSFSGGGAGGIYMKYPGRQLYNTIKNFKDLPLLLDEAHSLGTDIVYLWNYWEGFSSDDKRPYPNKGDYIPLSSLGGEKDLKIGIEEIHKRGGRIIVYVEPFIISKNSRIGKKYGELISIRYPNGKLMEFYKNTYTMNPYSAVWRKHLKAIVKRLVGEYDVDGIFLDSYSWRMNNAFISNEEGIKRTALEYSVGMLDLIREIRGLVQQIKSDAIVMGETTSGPVWQCWDGGLSADFAWQIEDNKGRIVTSPIKYGMPQVNFISNGRNLSQLNQIFAAGHNLALSYHHLSDSVYIKKLMNIRQQYKDALIYGKVLYHPYCKKETIASYRYQGLKSDLIIVVNTSDCMNFSDYIILKGDDKNKLWTKILGNGAYKIVGANFYMDINPKEMMIFEMQK